jgi:hypothetical protein
MGAGRCSGDGGDEKHAVEWAEELPGYRLVRGKARCGRSGRRRLLRPDEATLEGDPRVPSRGRRLPEATREGAAAAGVGRGRGDGHAGGWEFRGWGCLADGGSGNHGDDRRGWLTAQIAERLGWPFGDWNFELGIFVRLSGVLNFFF